MTTKEMNFTNMNIKDFIDYIITFDNIDIILDNCKTQSEKDFIFERLFDVVIKFGFYNIFTNFNFNHLIGNSNNAKLKILENLNQYLNKKVFSGNSGGCSDITLQNKNDNIYIFISSKYPKSNEDIKKQKSVDYYDIQNIIAIASKNKHIYKNYKIYLVFPNKKKILEKVKNANESSEYITEHMTEENILDKTDLNKYFLSFKQDIIENKNKDFIHMLNDIKESNELLEIFDDQCLIWWNKKGLINIIHDIINKYFDKSSNTYNVSIQFKMSIQSLLDKPKELLALISDCLKPKTIEKKTFGEVFTPIDFINNKMLKDIEDYWLKNKNENIWANYKLTWYDPATGMGNYPIAIYYKLMEGLKTKIPNEIERKKHIIEKQLYMSELNKKNCFVIKQIFNINSEYKLNLYEGDTLKINLYEIFGKNNFDIIIGNPPYNKELQTKKGSAPALYNKFIEYYMNKCNLLSFIVPSRWFAGGKGLDKFRTMMLKKLILYILDIMKMRVKYLVI